LKHGSEKGGPTDEDSLLEKLKTSAGRVPDQATAVRMRESHYEAIETSLRNRGDPFGGGDVLTLCSDRASEISIAVGVLPVSLGSGDADHVVTGSGISRQHCRLEKDGPFVKLLDTGSKNGTYLNGRRITSEYLCEGDRVRLGTIEFTVKRR